MWILRHLKDPGQCYYLPTGKELVIGRRDCDILLRSDTSVSRKHALLLIAEDNKAYVTDCKSKFGTFVGGVKLPWSSKEELGQNAVVKFGQMGAEYRLLWEPLMFCCSSMGGAEKSKLKQLAKSLDGKVVNSWTAECSHLIMSSITVTVKVISAISSCRPIVTLAWLEAAVRCMKSKQVFPDCAGYLPPVVDANIKDTMDSSAFKPNLKRTELFKGLTFYFLTEKQFSKLHLCVQQAGAVSRLANHTAGVPLEEMGREGSVVMTVDEVTLREEPERQKEWFGEVAASLASHGLRSVPDAEVGFALLHISTSVFCNPHISAEVTGLPDVSVGLPPPTLSQLPPTLSQLPPTLSQLPPTLSQLPGGPDHAPSSQDTIPDNVTIYAADTVSQSLAPVAIKQEEETFDGVGGARGVVRTGGTLRVNETVLERSKDAFVVKEEELLDDLFGSLEHEALTHNEAPGPSRSTVNPKSSDGSVNPSVQPSSLASSVAGVDTFSDSSVLATNSVSPVPRATSGGDPNMMSTLFRGKRKATGGAGEEGTQSKKSRVESAGEGSAGSKGSTPSEVDVRKVQVPVVKCSSKAGDAPKRAGSSTTDILPKKAIPVQPSGLLFSQQADGLGTRKRERGMADREESPDVGETPELDSESKRRCVTSSAVASATTAPLSAPVPKVDPGDSMASGQDRSKAAASEAKRSASKMASRLCDERDSPSLRSHRVEPANGDGEVPSSALKVTISGGRTTPPRELPVTLATPGGPASASAPATPVRLITMPTASTPFLSTRKHKAAAGKGVGEAATLPSQRRGEEERVKTQTQDSRGGPLSMVVGSHPSLVVGRTVVGMSPFKLFSGIGGKRSKVTDTEVVWKEGEEVEEEQGVEPWEGEDPLSNGVKYDPVVTEDGFICPRKQPKKIVPRGAFLSMSHDPGSTPSVPECVEVVRLVVVVEQRDGLGRRAVAASDGGKLRDFKRFRKIGSSGLTQMPRIVGLVEHAETSAEAQQWVMEQEEVREPYEDEAEVDDIFRFT